MLQEAIILAGGFGTRLKDVVSDVPKPMASVNEKPFLEYLLRYVAYYKIKKVVFSVGHLSEKIIEHYGNHFNDVEIVYAIEKEPLGTGGGIKVAMQQCNSQDILVLNGDSFFDIDLHSFYDKHSDSLSEFSLALKYISRSGRYGTITLGEFDLIRAFKEKTNKQQAGIINAGVYILNRETYNEETPKHKNFSIEKDFFEKKLNHLNMYGFTYDGYFIDIGIPEDYKQAQHDFKTFKY